MNDAKTVGARLLLPLVKLEPLATAATAPRTLDLDAGRHDGARTAWLTAVNASAESCLLLDENGRVCAASPAASKVLGGNSDAIGVKFADLVSSVDFTSGAAPDQEPERSMPPLRSLATGGLARGLMRLRVADGTLVTYDVVAVPLERQCAVLAFFVAV